MGSFLETKVISRRHFIKVMSTSAVALGLSAILPPGLVNGATIEKPGVIWLSGQECTGCTESVLAVLQASRTDEPDIRDFILSKVSLNYHEVIMAGAGYTAEDALQEEVAEGGYLLVVEGSIPSADDRYLMVAGKPLRYTLADVASRAAAVIAVGSCAAYGGIPAAGPTQGQGVASFISSKPLVNLPGCPLKPEWFFGTALYYLNYATLPPLDQYQRPLRYFSRIVHDDCPRRMNYMMGRYLTDWNDPRQEGYCLVLKGCKGIETHSDCPRLWWNNGVNWCINSNAPCAGCTEPKFYAGFSPLYKQTEPVAAGMGSGMGGMGMGGMGMK